MKLLKKMKKGFTLVELIVVIAVIATLAAVSVGVYFGVTDSAKKSNDQTVTNQMNKALLLDQTVNGQPKTPTDALDVLAKNGFVVTEMSPFQDGAYYLWDSVDNKMILINKEGEVDFPEDATIRANEDFEYFTFVRADNDKPAGHKYSYYLKDNYVGNINFTAGFDTGVNTKLETTTYSNSNEQDVIIRNNGESLIVNAPKDTVEHYGTVKDLTIESVDTTDCYHEHGYVANFKTFGAGKFIAESTAQFHQTKAEVETVLNGKPHELSTGAKYGVHKYNSTTGKCEFCTATDPNNPNVQPPVVEDEDKPVADGLPQIELYETGNNFNLRLNDSLMGEYKDQVSYYQIVFSTKYIVKSATYNLNKPYEFKIVFDSRANSSIPYLGFSSIWDSHQADLMTDDAAKPSDNNVLYKMKIDSSQNLIPAQSKVAIIADSLVEKCMIDNHKILPTYKISCIWTYKGDKNHYYLNLDKKHYDVLAGYYYDYASYTAYEQEHGLQELDIEVGVPSYEDFNNYTIKTFKEDGTLLGSTHYGNSYSQWLKGDKIASISEKYTGDLESAYKTIEDATRGYSNTFGYYEYTIDENGKIGTKRL